MISLAVTDQDACAKQQSAKTGRLSKGTKSLYDQVSFEASKLVTKSYSSSFSSATSLLDPEVREAVYSIYGFVRYADEIVDTFHGYDKEHLLSSFENEFYEGLRYGISMNPVLHSFQQTVRKYHIPDEFIRAFLKSMRADISKSVYLHENEMQEYIYGSADVVGLMCLKVFVNGDEDLFNRLKSPAMRLGSAFQKVNFLRDLKDDTEELDRRYFPQLNKSVFDSKAKEEIIKSIDEDFKAALTGIRLLPGRSRLAVYVAYRYYRLLLKKLKNASAETILTHRIRVAGPVKAMLMLKSLADYRLGLI